MDSMPQSVVSSKLIFITYQAGGTLQDDTYWRKELVVAKRVCSTCRHFSPAGFDNMGWCQNPKRLEHPSSKVLARSLELQCRDDWNQDLWEALAKEPRIENLPSQQPHSNFVPSRDIILPEHKKIASPAIDSDFSIFASRSEQRDRQFSKSINQGQPKTDTPLNFALILVESEEFLILLYKSWKSVSPTKSFAITNAGNRVTTLEHTGLNGGSVSIANKFITDLVNAKLAFAEYSNISRSRPGPLGFLSLTVAGRDLAQSLSMHSENQAIQSIVQNAKSKDISENNYREFDVALSFAGTERQLARALANIVVEAGYRVFYDEDYPAQLWGEDLAEYFESIYRLRSRYCVIFKSKQYLERAWTIHERKSAVARMLDERGRAYILPIQVDEVKLPGIPPTIAHLSLSQFSIEQIGAMLIEKISNSRESDE